MLFSNLIFTNDFLGISTITVSIDAIAVVFSILHMRTLLKDTFLKVTYIIDGVQI